MKIEKHDVPDGQVSEDAQKFSLCTTQAPGSSGRASDLKQADSPVQSDASLHEENWDRQIPAIQEPELQSESDIHSTHAPGKHRGVLSENLEQKPLEGQLLDSEHGDNESWMGLSAWRERIEDKNRGRVAVEYGGEIIEENTDGRRMKTISR